MKIVGKMVLRFVTSTVTGQNLTSQDVFIIEAKKVQNYVNHGCGYVVIQKF